MKRCGVRPRPKHDYLVAETFKSNSFVISFAEACRSIRTLFFHGAGLYAEVWQIFVTRSEMRNSVRYGSHAKGFQKR